MRRHGEIFNDVEHDRLRKALKKALQMVATGAARPHVLDFGCGSGNLTRQLLELGAMVTAADVSPEFLRMVRQQPGGPAVRTALLNGRDLREFGDESFDMVATYSVLHHVPDYMGLVGELCRVIRPGGVLYIDHEAAPRVWSDDPTLAQYRQAVDASERESITRFTDREYVGRQLQYWLRLARRRLMRDPRYWEEGDLHVWPDDHIEWSEIEARVEAASFRIEFDEDYLLYRKDVPEPIYLRFRDRTADMRVMIARRTSQR